MMLIVFSCDLLAIPMPVSVKFCVLGTISLLDTYIANAFQFVACIFIFLMVFIKDRSLKFDEMQLISLFCFFYPD